METPIKPDARDMSNSRDFSILSTAVKDRFEHISKSELFVVDSDKDTIWDRYLSSFPDGTNPMYRLRTEHDCSCCKNFVHNVGNVVAIVDGKIETVWDVDLPEPYATVAAAMDSHVRGLSIRSVFRTKERQYGDETSRELRDDGTTHLWHHFVARISNKHFSTSADELRGRFNSVADVFKRGLKDLSMNDMQTVLGLIKENQIYRGAEHKSKVAAFLELQKEYHALNSEKDRDLFIWRNIASPAAPFRNTVIGSLVQDLSKGKELSRAVKSFETKVAPMNYKRPTALITPNMIKQAIGTLKDLGLELAVERRFARLSDVSVNNVLFVDNSVHADMKDGLEGLLMESVKPVKTSIDNPTDISMDDFISNILPQSTTLELLVKNTQVENFMSITAPKNEGSGALFKWDNNFAWSYDGDIADSIKQRVKAAGGRIDAKLRVSLGWFNYDDLDLHAIDPSGVRIFFGNKNNVLDVDMNVNSRGSRNAVENLHWDDPADGNYRIIVNQYTKRETVDVGFEMELDFLGVVYKFLYPKAVSGSVSALTLTVENGSLVSFTVDNDEIIAGSTPQTKWGVTTESLTKINMVLSSPNHWDGLATGNKHWFFILDGCLNPNPARGIYNEFLKPSLEKHRKVFEVLGAKMKCPWTGEQLSGLGFSSTRGDTAVIVAKGPGLNRAYNVKM